MDANFVYRPFSSVHWGDDPKKKTVLVYGHLDVQPAQKSDGWDTEPFELVIKDGKMYGRGSTDDKGPVVAWINAIEVLNALNVEIPVNLKFVLEGMEESGSEGLDDVLKKHKDTFLHDVEATCISDNYWLGKNKPCLTYGLRGISYFLVEVSAPKQDLHSGVFGGSIHEPMNSLIHILSTLSDVDGTIKVEGLDKLIAPLTKEEEALYKSIDFNVVNYRSDIGVKKLVSESRETILMNRWRYPALSVHGVEGAFYGNGAKTVIPSKVIGKFSIRLVPNMEPDVVADLVVKYLEKEWTKLQSPCNFKVIPLQGGKPWLADFNHPHYQAGVRAIEKVFKTKPDFTREGGSIPVTLTFQELTGKNVMLLPLGSCDDMAHSQNEKNERFQLHRRHQDTRCLFVGTGVLVIVAHDYRDSRLLLDSQTTDSLRSWNHNNESLLQMSDEEIRELIVQQDEILKKQAEMIVDIDSQFAEEETDAEFLQMLNQRRNLQRTLRNLRSMDWEGLRLQRSEDLSLLKHQYNQLRLRLLAIKQQLERMRIEEITLIHEIESFHR
ncbi:Cytosolic non-specific dipeptidase [Aphelenchoides besseyi]|nr:Cytosolic non-specific dipeptidase [Aphelenchoides besseyi]